MHWVGTNFINQFSWLQFTGANVVDGRKQWESMGRDNKKNTGETINIEREREIEQIFVIKPNSFHLLFFHFFLC